MTNDFTNRKLIPYWISFPEDYYYPLGFGVTAFSIEDAYSIFEKFGFEYHKTAKKINVIENIRYDDIPYPNKIGFNTGPIVVRGIWYPHLNSRLF